MALDISGITFNDGEPLDSQKFNKLKQAIIDVDNNTLKIANTAAATAAGVITSTFSAGTYDLGPVTLTGSQYSQITVPMNPELSGTPMSIVCTVTTAAARPDFTWFIKKGSEKTNQFQLVLHRVKGITDKTETSDTYSDLKVNYIAVAKPPVL